jgi:hypothetical protein
MRAHLLAGLLVLCAPGCTYTIEQLASVGTRYSRYSSMTPTHGRAYFLKKAWYGTRVVVCDVRSADGSVVCYDTSSAQRSSPE